jgi:hypothetical protein
MIRDASDRVMLCSSVHIFTILPSESHTFSSPFHLVVIVILVKRHRNNSIQVLNLLIDLHLFDVLFLVLMTYSGLDPCLVFFSFFEL